MEKNEVEKSLKINAYPYLKISKHRNKSKIFLHSKKLVWSWRVHVYFFNVFFCRQLHKPIYHIIYLYNKCQFYCLLFTSLEPIHAIRIRPCPGWKGYTLLMLKILYSILSFILIFHLLLFLLITCQGYHLYSWLISPIMLSLWWEH